MRHWDNKPYPDPLGCRKKTRQKKDVLDSIHGIWVSVDSGFKGCESEPMAFTLRRVVRQGHVIPDRIVLCEGFMRNLNFDDQLTSSRFEDENGRYRQFPTGYDLTQIHDGSLAAVIASQVLQSTFAQEDASMSHYNNIYIAIGSFQRSFS